jgi:glycosyltransferase involved in cell wall biosynthesis
MDHIIVVVQESKERLVSLGVPPDRITVVHNTPSRERVNAMGRKTLTGRTTMSDELRLCYLGLMEAPRGIEVILDALRELVGREVAVHLDLIGDGRDLEIFQEQAKRLRLLPDRVTFHGFVPYGDALEIVGRSDVGLVPHIANESWNSTIPNKLFDYMAAGLPVITSDAKPAARIVSQTGSGRVYTSTDPTSLADAVCDLRSFQNRVEAGTAGRNAVLKKFNWELDGARLVEAVEGVVSCP